MKKHGLGDDKPSLARRMGLAGGIVLALWLSERAHLRARLTRFLLEPDTSRAALSATAGGAGGAGGGGGPPALVRHGAKLAAVLAVVSAWLVNKAREDAEMDAEEVAWVQSELHKQRDRLEGVLSFANAQLEKLRNPDEPGAATAGDVPGEVATVKDGTVIDAAAENATGEAAAGAGAPASGKSGKSDDGVAAGEVAGDVAGDEALEATDKVVGEVPGQGQGQGRGQGQGQSQAQVALEVAASSAEAEAEAGDKGKVVKPGDAQAAGAAEDKAVEPGDEQAAGEGAGAEAEAEAEADAEAEAQKHLDDDKIDIGTILDATEDVAQFDRSDPLVHKGLLCAAQSVCANILRVADAEAAEADAAAEASADADAGAHAEPGSAAASGAWGASSGAWGPSSGKKKKRERKRGVLDENLSSKRASDLVEQLEFEEEIFDHAETFLLDERPYRAALREAVERAKLVIRLRRKNQLLKTLALLERAKSQLPYVVISAALSVVQGSIYALKTHYMGSVMMLAYNKTTATALRGEGASGSGSGSGSGRSIFGTIRTLFLLEALGLLSDFVCTKTKSMGRRQFVLQLKTDLFRSLITQDMAYFETHDMYEARQNIGNAEYVCMSLFDLPIDTIQNVSSMSASALMLWAKNRKLATLLAILLPSRMLLAELLGRLELRVEASIMTAQVTNFSDVWTVLVNPTALRTMRSFAREPVETAMFSQGLKVKDRSKDRGTMVYNVFEILRALVENSAEIAALWYGGDLASKGELDVADLASFSATAGHAFARGRTVYYAFKGLFTNNGIVDQAEKMYDLLHAAPGIGVDAPPLAGMPRDEDATWSVEFRGVSFAYPKRQKVKALDDVSFRIEEGEQVGVLGETGCGKSTLIALLLRLYDPDKGEVRMGERPLKQLNPLWLRRHIAIVSQNIYLPYRTVKENLAYGLFDLSSLEQDAGQSQNQSQSQGECEAQGEGKGHKDDGGVSVSGSGSGSEEEEGRLKRGARDEDMRAAMRMARCEDLFFDVKRFPQQWHTDIGRDGCELSGGERQRLCIARAILTKPKVLILDEATSALDEESQFQVQEAIQALFEASGKRLTIISVAHRISNFRHVDKLVVLDKGKVVEIGEPRHLARKLGGVFANYVTRTLDSIPVQKLGLGLDGLAGPGLGVAEPPRPGQDPLPAPLLRSATQ